MTGPEQHSHLQPKQETEQVNEEWYVAFETSESAPSKILLQHGCAAKTSTNSATNWAPSIQAPEPMGDISAKSTCIERPCLKKKKGDNLHSVFSGKSQWSFGTFKILDITSVVTF